MSRFTDSRQLDEPAMKELKIASTQADVAECKIASREILVRIGNLR